MNKVYERIEVLEAKLTDTMKDTLTKLSRDGWAFIGASTVKALLRRGLITANTAPRDPSQGVWCHYMLTDAGRKAAEGTTTHVSIREAHAEVDAAMMGPRKNIREMSSGRTAHHIKYADGREVRMTLVDAPEPAPVQERTALIQRRQDGNHIMGPVVTVKGKDYVVGAVVMGRFVDYWSERDGERFGPSRRGRAADRPGTVGRAIWDAVNR